MTNRVIKFRAWISAEAAQQDEGMMISQSDQSDFMLISNGDGFGVVCDFDSWLKEDDFRLMQFTGLHDKNGVEIYEGDILYHNIQGARQVIYPMHDQMAGFGIVSSDGKLNTLQDAEFIYKVVGNIYENPELLEDRND